MVWTIPKAQLLGLFGQKHTTFAERRRVLMKNSLFRDLRDEQIEALCRMVTEKSVRGGDTVYRAGDSAENIYFVVKGAVKLCMGANKTLEGSSSSFPSKGSSSSSLFEVDRVYENSSFGEVETILGFSGYGSTTVALSTSEGGTSSRTLLLVLAKDLCPSVCRAVAPKIAKRLVFDVIRSIPSFSNLGNASIFELVKLLRCSNVMKGKLTLMLKHKVREPLSLSLSRCTHTHTHTHRYMPHKTRLKHASICHNSRWHSSSKRTRWKKERELDARFIVWINLNRVD